MIEKEPIFLGTFDKAFCFESYGVKLRIESNLTSLLDEARRVILSALPGQVRFIENVEAGGSHAFGIAYESGYYFLLRNGEQIRKGKIEWRFFRFFNSMIRVEVAEYAVSRVFIHAGVVGVKDRAIVLPALSFRGKSTLTAELIKNGADYYSDEYAVLDEKGFVHSFPRKLSMRSFDGSSAYEVPAEELGARHGDRPIPVGMVLLTEYKRGARWTPRLLSPGNGIIEMIPHTIPIRYDPEFSLKVLDKAVRNAIIVKSARSDVKKFAKILLAFFDNHIN